MRRVIRSDVEGRRDENRARKHQRRYANRHGYFWLPCPLCGVEFGGHEPHGHIPVNGSESHSEGICPACTAERQEAAERYLASMGVTVPLSTTRWGFQSCLQHQIGKDASGRATDGLIA